MTDQAKVKQVLSTGQVTFLFFIFVSMLFVIFTVGVYIGRWSQPTMDRKTEALKTANINFVEPTVNSAVSSGSGQQSSTESVRQSLPGSPLSMRVDEKTTSGYAVQIATVSTMAEADGLLTQLKRDGLTRGYVRSPEPGSVAQLFSVEIAFDDKTGAEQAVSQLKGKGLTRSRVIQVYADKKVTRQMDQSAQPPTAP